MKRKPVFYLVFFAVLLAGFYLALMATSDFGKVKLPVLSKVHPFKFLRQDSVSVDEHSVNGKVYVAEYFFTTCKGICPKMNRNMDAIHKEFGKEKDFLILSHTVDPETDSLPVLRRYADSIGADPAVWWFLTGSKEELYRSARESYLLDDPENNSKNIKEQFLHTQFFALVDRRGQVRGIYDGLKKDELRQLNTDIGKLLKEQ